jgi:desulfoferrodoxin (superoxide reductase-like protein)
MTYDVISRRNFVSRAGSCAGLLAVSPWLVGCVAEVGEGGDLPNEVWEDQAALLEGSKVYDSKTLWNGEPKAAAHVPQARAEADKVIVYVPHPMTQAHWITTVYLRDPDGLVVAFEQLPMPREDQDAMGVTVMFDRPSAASVTAYADCNLHDVWKSEPLRLT